MASRAARPVALIVGGILILVIEAWGPRSRFGRVSDTPAATALGVGMAQILALIPGTSRSGATIMGAYTLGMSRTAATEFSFLLAVPIMFAATALDLSRGWTEITPADTAALGIGFVVSFFTALVVVKAFLRFVSSHSFRAFAWYRIVLGFILLGYYVVLSG